MDLSKTIANEEKVIRVTRERYGTKREIVEEKIARWAGMVTEKDLGINKDELEISESKYETMKYKKTPAEAKKPKEGLRSSSASADERKMFPAVCATCEVDIRVPFKPDGTRPTFCKDCLKDFQRQQANVQQV